MRPVIIVMGVSASGKSVVGAGLAHALAVPFCEGDDLHPAANIAKMRAGIPLDDADRAPWLDRISGWVAAHPDGGVVSCSALRHRHRDRLRSGQAPTPLFVLLDPPITVLRHRVAARVDHFMPASLLQTQLETLERPSPNEHALVLSGAETPECAIVAIRDWLQSVGQPGGCGA